MQGQSITSLPVVDNQNNVVGNISHVDVRVSLPSASQLHACIRLILLDACSFSPNPPLYHSSANLASTSSPSSSQSEAWTTAKIPFPSFTFRPSLPSPTPSPNSSPRDPTACGSSMRRHHHPQRPTHPPFPTLQQHHSHPRTPLQHRQPQVCPVST